MLLSSQLPLSSLIELCRVLRHNLSAGLRLVEVFRQQALRGPAPVRPVAERICRQLENGNDLQSALEQQRGAFPPLFVNLAVVAEQTGKLPEVFHELERYYTEQQRLRRLFWAGAAWPLIQFFLAIFVLAGLILILGIIADIRGPGINGKPWDPLGFGLLGPSGAAIFLAIIFGSLGAVAAVYLVLTRALRQKAAVDSFLLAVPIIGPCLQALALARFCLALRLTMETGMSIIKALRLSLRATGNAAFADRAPVVKRRIEEGDDLTVALAATRLFPTDFVNIMANAEEGGRVTEVLDHQTDHYQDEARVRMTVLTMAASWGVWLFVAGCIVFVVFRIFLSYLDLLDSLMK